MESPHVLLTPNKNVSEYSTQLLPGINVSLFPYFCVILSSILCIAVLMWLYVPEAFGVTVQYVLEVLRTTTIITYKDRSNSKQKHNKKNPKMTPSQMLLLWLDLEQKVS